MSLVPVSPSPLDQLREKMIVASFESLRRNTRFLAKFVPETLILHEECCDGRYPITYGAIHCFKRDTPNLYYTGTPYFLNDFDGNMVSIREYASVSSSTFE